MDLLRHEVVVAVTAGRRDVPRDRDRRRLDSAPVGVDDADDTGADLGDLVVGDGEELPRRRRRAARSDATTPTSSVRPTMRGDVRRVATMTSGSAAATTAMAKSPVSRPIVRRTASVRPAPEAISASIR